MASFHYCHRRHNPYRHIIQWKLQSNSFGIHRYPVALTLGISMGIALLDYIMNLTELESGPGRKRAEPPRWEKALVRDDICKNLDCK